VDIEQTVVALRKDVTAARQRHAGATAGAAQAAARAEAVREDLQAEFGVSTVAQAQEQLAALERQLEDEAAAVRSQLEQAGEAQ
jgi:hypothetical protein